MRLKVPKAVKVHFVVFWVISELVTNVSEETTAFFFRVE
jgi:hypothetical protein